VFAQSNISGSWLWNLLGRYEHVLESNESLDCSQSNECCVLFVSVIFNINVYNFIFYLKCLPEAPFFSTGSSYPPSTNLSGFSESHSYSATALEPSLPSADSKRVRNYDKALVARLQSAGLEVYEFLCLDLKPTLQIMYQCYIHGTQLWGQISDMVNERTWPKALGKAPNHTEVVLLFVAKTTWHEIYARVFPLVDGYEDMQAWLEEDPNRKSDLQIWKVINSKYTIKDLKGWLKKQKGKKPMTPAIKSAIKSIATPATKSVTKSTVKPTTKSATQSTRSVKVKEDKSVLASGSKVRKGKKGVVPEEVDTKKKKSHKKKPTASTDG